MHPGRRKALPGAYAKDGGDYETGGPGDTQGGGDGASEGKRKQGVLAMVDSDGAPYAIPVNHALIDGARIIHCAGPVARSIA